MKISIEQDGFATVKLESTIATEISSKEGVIIGEGGMYGEPGLETAQAKSSVMSSWVFVVGITAATLAISIVLGILLAKKRIKKGFDLYED